MSKSWVWVVLLVAAAACGTNSQRLTPPDGSTDGGSSVDGGSVDAPVDAAVGSDAPSAVCGNGIMEPGETCDDGNLLNGDGCSADCSVATCFVPVTHPTIAAAIADASCTTITVYSGTYAENLAVPRALTIVGVGVAPVIVDGSHAGSVITASAALVLQNLTVQNGLAARGGGIETTAALTLQSVDVENNMAQGALAAFGGGIDSSADPLVIEDSTIGHNQAVITDTTSTGTRTIAGGGLYHIGVDVQITSGTFAANALQGGGSSLTAHGGAMALDAITDSTSPAADPAEQSHFVLTGVDITGNSIDLGTAGLARGGGVWVTSTSAWWEPKSTFDMTNTQISNNTLHAKTADGGGVMIEAPAFFVDNEIDVTATGCTIDGNTITASTGTGGGLDVLPTIPASPTNEDWRASVSITGTHIGGNTITAATAEGGGLAIPVPTAYDNGSTVTMNLSLTQSSVVANEVNGTTALGAGIYQSCHQCRSLLLIQQSLVGGNQAIGSALAEDGGVGVYWVHAQIVNSTVSGNSAQSTTKARAGGVGVHSNWLAKLDIASSTIVENTATAPNAGGDSLYVFGVFQFPGSDDDQRSAILLTLANSILDDCFGELDTPNFFDYEPTSLGYNLFSTAPDPSCQFVAATGDQTAAPGLLPLGDNGGPTQTQALDATSPALNAGNPAGCSFDGLPGGLPSGPLATDQRGMPREDGVCDIGAVEM